jgi:predicted nucleotidyltransferase component of viral defense system
VAEQKTIDPALVEKDYWIMHCLYGLQQLRLQFELKGGTSLSKGYQIIDRFSEDIDIHPDRERHREREIRVNQRLISSAVGRHVALRALVETCHTRRRPRLARNCTHGAGTHNHRSQLEQKASATVPARSRGRQ